MEGEYSGRYSENGKKHAMEKEDYSKCASYVIKNTFCLWRRSLFSKLNNARSPK